MGMVTALDDRALFVRYKREANLLLIFNLLNGASMSRIESDPRKVGLLMRIRTLYTDFLSGIKIRRIAVH